MNPADLLRDIENIDAVLRDGTEKLSQQVRADLLGRRQKLYLLLQKHAIQHGGARRGWKQKNENRPSFVKDTSAALGISQSTVRRLLRLASENA